MKAFRKHAVKWHPDKYHGEDKAHAEKMFIDVASAKEVLTDPGQCSRRAGREMRICVECMYFSSIHNCGPIIDSELFAHRKA